MNDEVRQEMEHDADKDVNVATALNTPPYETPDPTFHSNNFKESLKNG